MNNKKVSKIIDDAYVQLYDKAECVDGKKHSWETMKRCAVVFESEADKRGRIPFNAFYVDQDELADIVEGLTKKKHSFTKQTVSFSVYLGPSPTSCKEHFDDLKEAYQKHLPQVNKDMDITDIAKITRAPIYSDLNLSLLVLPYIED